MGSVVCAALPADAVAQESAACAAYMDSRAGIPRLAIVDAPEVPLTWRAPFCNERGPAQIARLWALTSLTDRQILQIASLSRIADVRIADTLIAVARRTSASSLLRSSAIVAMSQQVFYNAPGWVAEL